MKKKTLLDKLGERYYTIEHNGGYLLYDKEGKAKRANMLFKGLFYLASSGKSYVFQEEYYETPEELIHAMEEWAKTLPFDVELYNPSFKKSYMIECAVHDYLEMLGFVIDRRTCTLSDASGKELCTIECKVEDGKSAVPSHNQSPKTVGRKRSLRIWTRLSELATFCCPPIV